MPLSTAIRSITYLISKHSSVRSGRSCLQTAFWPSTRLSSTGLIRLRAKSSTADGFMRSLRILKREHGMSPDAAQKVESRQHLSAEQYEQLLEESGFRIVKSEVADIDVPESGWFHISGFRDWIEGVLPGVPARHRASGSAKRAAASLRGA